MTSRSAIIMVSIVLMMAQCLDDNYIVSQNVPLKRALYLRLEEGGRIFVTSILRYTSSKEHPYSHSKTGVR